MITIKIEIRAGDVTHVEGYVNAVGRDSRPLPSPRGKFVEQVAPDTFRRAITDKKPDVMLNHKRTLDADADFTEDNIGLHVSAEIRDAEVAAAARRGELHGWSFGFSVNPGGDTWDDTANPYPRRALTDIDLAEVSLIAGAMTPAYIGTSVETRGETDVETRSAEDDTVELADTATADKNKIEIERKKLEILKLRCNI